jgi:hypothetical protein
MISAEMTTPTLCTRSAALLQTYIAHVALKISFQCSRARRAPIRDHGHDHDGGPHASTLSDYEPSACGLHDCVLRAYIPFHQAYEPNFYDHHVYDLSACGNVPSEDGAHRKRAYETQLVKQQAFSSSMY